MAKARGKPRATDDKKKNPSPTAATATQSFDLARFTAPQPSQRSSFRWFDSLSVASQDYLLDVAELFQTGRATWTMGAAFDQLRQELGLQTSKSTFTSFLRGIGSYRNFKQEVQDARANEAWRQRQEKAEFEQGLQRHIEQGGFLRRR